ncbi:hypothetical protein CONPUDRAFT_136968 [Coniophora puteana RWD-64-598 SS2]|uniref:BZIP domain-containing protein n=1 Tax=Coniophora puteana (strain RWD-64-598) TaxID=741705 RepID=A0A5M3MUS6_CONPW|nr:uncharacterized protein CONPUDRAFT_136968 [Coniophora puteana RWD-64-598 SS2]EIW82475.1 hypothetical protein CONPUDRAFT_136968 [Coniophora puteana RWD-64-598 SS2]
MSNSPPRNADAAASASSSHSDKHQQQQSSQPRKIRSDFDLEPNPFEQSFSRPSHVRHTSAANNRDTNTSSPVSVGKSSDKDRPSSAASKNDARSASPRPVLPPLAALASPSENGYNWQFSSLANSLRAGPLSPAMLAGPQQGSDSNSHLPFDPSSFRTGLTPRSGLTPRTGLTPGTGLTPLVGGPVSFPPPSPNTAAFLALMNNSSANSGSNATITPNTLSAITGVLNGSNGQQYNNSTPHVPSSLSTSHTAKQEDNNGNSNGNSGGDNAINSNNNSSTSQESQYLANASNAAATAANGLYLLSQAHQELTKREEAQARANGATPAVNGKRGAKRKSYDLDSPPPPPAPTARTANQGPAPTKRARANTATSTTSTGGLGKNSLDGEEEEEEEDFDDDDEQERHQQNPQGGRKQKKPETEEEKRKNFLERNRQAALKCRQRKKAWLAQLQAKVEYLQNENERLTSALVSSREEISRLSALVGGAVIGPGGSTVGSGMVPSAAPTGVSADGFGVAVALNKYRQPVSMNMNLNSKAGASAAAASRSSGGYGY